jgi:tRNA G26 N,N-dimethylase Trm1
MEEDASNYLHSLGIRGIRYKAEQGQSEANNYVVFNDADVKIEVKYSKNGDVIAFYNPADDTTYLVHDNITQNTEMV